MNLPELGVKRPVLTMMIFFGILVLGVVSLTNLPLDLMPELTLPAISLIVPYEGAATEDVEVAVTEILESYLSTVPNLKEITSKSKEGVSLVVLTFEWGTNMDEASNDIRDRLDFAKSFLPEDVGQTILFKFDMSNWPILFLGIGAEESYPKLTDIIDKRVADPLKRLKGIGSISQFAGLERQIQVRVDRERLLAHHLTIDQLVLLLQKENITLPAGNLKMGKQEFLLRVPGELETVEDIQNLMIQSRNGASLRLKDVAEVEDSFREEEGLGRVDGRPGMMMMIQKQAGANTVEVATLALKRLEELKKRLPRDVEIKIIFDGSDFIKQSLSNLNSTILWGGVLVILTILLFLGNFTGSLIIALTIPFSLIIAFIFLYFMGYTINTVSLSSLAIAIGMVVDNAIVVLDSIFRKRDEGESPATGSISGAKEVGTAVSASTFTTIAIFVPILFIGGIIGEIFRQLGYVVTIVLLASLFCALNLTPMLASKLLKDINPLYQRGIKGDFTLRTRHSAFRNLLQLTQKGYKNLEEFYLSLLSWALSHRRRTILIGLSIFFLSLLPIPLHLVETEFIPAEDQGEVRGTIELPLGTRVEVTEKVMKRVEEEVEKTFPDRIAMMSMVGQSRGGFATMSGQKEGSSVGRLFIKLHPKRMRDYSAQDAAYLLSRKISSIPGIQNMNFDTEDPFASMIFSGGSPVSIEIYGYEIEKTDSIAFLIRERLSNIKGIVHPLVSREKGKPEIQVVINREKASRMGLSISQIAHTLRTNFFGKEATLFREGGEEYDIFVRLKEEDRKTLRDLENVFVNSPTGKAIPLSNIADFVERRGPLEIDRKNRERLVKVEAGIYKRPLSAIKRDLEKVLSEIHLPEGVFIQVTGAIEEQESAFEKLFIAMILGILLVYMVMAGQFESLLDPFVIMFSVPFAITGVIWALFLTGKTLNLMSFVGMVMLVGIVVNNAIVLIDYTNILRRRGLSVREAHLTAGTRRLRPVLMTSLTTVLGLLPLAMMRGEGAESWSPLAISVMGGLLVSTLITLIFVPTLHSIFDDWRERKRERQKQ